ncbi:PLP-dependent aminotransferase family protein [Clostridium sp. AM58-1XD]|uniref:MocR-like pyridoxine biosynthesis transcription factor PdxR n=1 Tax=Clostridium sp. AM58-1XD TaxID=2292307 RepID=UPI000E472839|nr:PLP-dependent aminotransferase family protein [Clostridium sp. AM58-1XD]RGY99676.1 PLP-dependent aminotransferase family protein [Clostridium sp. AM58-1XD]
MELMIPLNVRAPQPLYEQIYEYIKSEIKSGSLKSGMRLPSTRTLAEHLKVSRSTTQLAYDQLCSEGYVESVPCRGYFVSQIDDLLIMRHEHMPEILIPPVEEKDGCEIDFSPRGIDLNSFPFQTWRKISKNTLIDDNREMFAAGDRQGEGPLREAIRDYLHSARGVNCSAEQIVVGAGSEYLLMLLGQVLDDRKIIAMENPTYKQAYRVLESIGRNVVPVAMDSQGMNPEKLEGTQAQVAYIMPSHQYPTGIVMPVKRRQELLSWAYREEGRYLIEDDYDSEFRYRGKPVPALQGMDTGERVIYLGTFSKSIAPAIRISYMVLPVPLLKKYREKAGFYASTVSRIDQNILYRFLVDGHYERHLNRMRAIYKSKHDRLLAELRQLEGTFEVRGEFAGLHILLTARNKPDGDIGNLEQDLTEAALKAGARVYGLSSWLIGDGEVPKEWQGTVALGYANLTEKEIERGVGLLKKAWSYQAS